MITALWIGGGIVWLIGFFTSLHDVLEDGKSLKEYREKYGHDLGLIACGFARGFVTVLWPVFGGLKFGVGAVRDTIRLILGKEPKEKKINK